MLDWMLPEAASSVASTVDTLFHFVNIVSTIIFVGVIGSMFYFIIRYRHRKGKAHTPNPLKENRLVEVGWIVVPLILSLIVFTWGFKLFLRLNTIPPDAYQIQVTAKQWAWDFSYAEGAQTVNELHVPEGQPVSLLMSSEDVLHSLYIPAFRIKLDVLPDRYTSVWFEAERPGEYPLLCTEYCGLSHSNMLAKVVVHTQKGFRDWLDSQVAVDPSTMTPVEYGALLYQQQTCFACHSLDGTRGAGPTFKALFGKTEQLEGGGSVLVDENYLRESILAPNEKIVATYPPAMPATYSALEPAQLDALIAFIKSIE